MNQSNSFSKIVLSAFFLVIFCITVCWGFLYHAWNITEYIDNFSQYFIVGLSIMFLILITLTVVGRYLLVAYVYFNNLAAILMAVFFMIACGGVWYKHLDIFYAHLVNALYCLVLLILAIFRIHTFDVNSVVSAIDKKGIIKDGNYDFNVNLILVEDILTILRNRKQTFIFSLVEKVALFFGIAFGNFVFAIALSLDRLGHKDIAIAIIVTIFYFITFIFTLSNDNMAHFIFNRALLKNNKLSNKNIRMKWEKV